MKFKQLPSAIFLVFFALSTPAQSSTELPEGDGKQYVKSICSSCHSTDLIIRSAGYDQDGWRYLTGKMVALPATTSDTLIKYLATNFPATTDRKPTLIDGDVQIFFREWTVPTLGQRARDPLQMADGTIWWAGMYASLIGRLNPATGEMKEYRLATGAKPHSIINDRDGNIWYTGNGNGTIGMLDPKTEKITVYPMPDPDAKDPHTPIFSRNGDLWFTLQRSNMVGQLDPDSGKIKLRTMPTDNARPYGIKEDSVGNLWIAYNGSNKIARLNPDTWDIREFPTPTPSSRIRRLALTSDDVVWYVDAARGYLGRLDPDTGEISEWASPSGGSSAPYGIEVIDDIVWYNESGQRPDSLVRFDPGTETFQSWAIPSGVGIIRHMRKTPSGNLVIHQSSTNTVGIVTIGSAKK